MNIAFTGGDLPGHHSNFPVKSVTECQEACQKRQDCQSFTAVGRGGVDERKACYLKGGPGSWRFVKPYPWAISGLRNCRGKENVFMLTISKGWPLATVYMTHLILLKMNH